LVFYFDKPSIQLLPNNVALKLKGNTLGERSYKERLVLIGCMLGVIGFIPFTIYRFVNGDYLLALIESCLGICMLGVFIYVWRSHKVELASAIMCALFLSVIAAVVHIKGPSLIYWAYPGTLACFCILKARTAAIFNLVNMLILFPALYPTLGSHEVFLIYTTLTLLSLFGYAFTLMSSQQHIELSKLAAKDGLTGAWNRRSLDDDLAKLLSKHQRKPITASLVIMDLDHFKNINDTYGHGVGDEILIKVAALLRSVVRLSDQIYRYGGEEFVLVAEDADLKEAAVLAETIRSRVEKSQLFEKHEVTISLGVAELSQASTVQRWLALADEALYRAKDEGRNRCCLAQTTDLQQVA